MSAFKRRFQLEDQLAFYLSYHRNTTNRNIHLLCIWPIFITAQVILASVSPKWLQPSTMRSDSFQFTQCFYFNYATLVAAIYIPWYILLDPVAGSFGAMLVLASTLFANYVSLLSPIHLGLDAWKLALPLHLLGWIAQVIGHAMYEKQKPALVDSLDQALITAPMFVLLEILFHAGYKPDLYDRVLRRASKNTHSQKANRCSRR